MAGLDWYVSEVYSTMIRFGDWEAILAEYNNDSDRSQVTPDGKRFLLLVPAGKNAAPPIDFVVNWPALLKKAD